MFENHFNFFIEKVILDKKNYINNYNKMKMDAEKPVPYSLLASMYGAWEQYQVPAVFYHYLLAVLPQLEKKK